MAFGLSQPSALHLAQLVLLFVTPCGYRCYLNLPVSPISWLGPLPLSELTGKQGVALLVLADGDPCVPKAYGWG